MKVHWRGARGDRAPPFHAFVRIGKNSSLGMNFSTLCLGYWASTVQYGKPKPYPPEKTECCTTCLERSRKRR